MKGLTRINLGSAAAAVPYAQTQTVNAIKKAVAARAGVTLTINSALRTLPQQYSNILLIKKWIKFFKIDFCFINGTD